jgi:hypothetical protein
MADRSRVMRGNSLSSLGTDENSQWNRKVKDDVNIFLPMPILEELGPVAVDKLALLLLGDKPPNSGPGASRNANLLQAAQFPSS